MKKFLFAALIVSCLFSASDSYSQTGKNWSLIGGDIAGARLGFQKNNTNFSLDISPRVAWFIADNVAVGVSALLGLSTAHDYTNVNYGIGPVARYYTGKSLDVLRKTRWFGDVNVGFYGSNSKVSGGPKTSTNGIGFGFGPGLAYFVTSNIAFEALAKYNLTAGFGNSTTDNSLTLQIGFQIHLPRSKLRSIQNNDVKSK